MAIPPEDQPRFGPIRVAASIWLLEANPGRIEGAANAWRRLAAAGQTIGDDLDGESRHLLGSQWAGDARDTFAAHQGKVVSSLDSAAAQARGLATELDAIADLLRRCQSALDTAREQITSSIPSSVSIHGTVFYPRSPEQVAAIRVAVSAAQALRTELDQALTATFRSGDWNAIAARWDAVACGATDPFTLPAEATGVAALMVDGRAVVNTGPGDDDVRVTRDPGGQVIVEVNGVKHYYPPGTPVTIRAGDGNDHVEVPKGANLSITMLGGRGSDDLRGGDGGETVIGLHGRDRVHGGGGNDYVSAGSGRDYVDGQGGDDIISGGMGDDVLYGLSGDDRIAGGEGRDYLEGATGDDTIHGGAGADVVSGGRDSDRLDGGIGDDVLYGGHGRDTVAGSDALQEVRVEVSDAAQYIEIRGSAEFQERVRADLEMMRASPIGSLMLEELDDIHRDSAAVAADWPVLGGVSYQGNPIVIEEADSNTARYRLNWHLGEDYTVTYNPSRLSSSDERPPIAGLYHEFAHIYDYGNNTSAPGDHEGPTDAGVENDEREAVGLPVDEDDDPNTPGTIWPEHPYEYTENRFREEMGWPTRKSYR